MPSVSPSPCPRRRSDPSSVSKLADEIIGRPSARTPAGRGHVLRGGADAAGGRVRLGPGRRRSASPARRGRRQLTGESPVARRPRRCGSWPDAHRHAGRLRGHSRRSRRRSNVLLPARARGQCRVSPSVGVVPARAETPARRPPCAKAPVTSAIADGEPSAPDTIPPVCVRRWRTAIGSCSALTGTRQIRREGGVDIDATASTSRKTASAVIVFPIDPMGKSVSLVTGRPDSSRSATPSIDDFACAVASVTATAVPRTPKLVHHGRRDLLRVKDPQVVPVRHPVRRP